MQPEAERFRKPIGVAGERAEQHPADDDVMEVGHEEKAVVQHEVRRGYCQQDAGHAADHEGDHEADRPQYRCGIDDPAAIHREEPVEDLHTRGHRDDHRSDAEDRVDVGAGAHGEEVVQPHRE